MNSLRVITSPIVVCALLGVCWTGKAQSPESVESRLASADAVNVLNFEGLKPWHMKMAVQIFNNDGEPFDEGTVEEWWNGPEEDRREYKTKTYVQTEVRENGFFYRSTTSGSPPHFLKLLRNQVVHPMPLMAEVKASTPQLKKEPFGKVPLDCIMLTQPVKHVPDPPIGLYPTYCFDPGKDILRASFELGDETILRNKIGTFQGKTIALDIRVMAGKTVLASGQVMELRTEDLPASLFQPMPLLIARPAGGDPNTNTATTLDQKVVAGKILSQPAPIYPAAAKASGSTGIVTLHALIGTDGHIEELRLLSTPDPLLAASAIAAVRKWTYKPYVLNGQPTEVETMITVNYNIR